MAASVSRALGVQSNKIWLLFTGLYSAELKPSETTENHMSATTTVKRSNTVNDNRFKLFSV